VVRVSADEMRSRTARADQLAKECRKNRAEREDPNPKLVRELIEKLRKLENSPQALHPIARLGYIAVVDHMRGEVLSLLRANMKNNQRQNDTTLTRCFCRWADASCDEELLAMVCDPSGKSDFYRDDALRALRRLGTPACSDVRRIA
jgi:hypothetical protein